MKTTSNELLQTPYEKAINLIFQKFEKYNDSVVKFFTSYDTDFFQREVAPGKNRASYLLGHLVVANDELFNFLGLGSALYPELLDLYFSADRAYPDEDLPVIPELLDKFRHVNSELRKQFAQIPLDTWMEKHELVSPEAFEADPSRTKLSVLLNRVLHLEHHLGQLYLMPSPFEVVRKDVG